METDLFLDALNALGLGDGIYVTKPLSSITTTVKGHFVPDVQRIHYNNNKTIVWFTDNTKVIVECSSADSYDRQTALAYAICKRLYGKVNDKGIVEGNGFGTYMKKLVDAGFDQVKNEQEALERKRTAKREHEARQAKEKSIAFEKRARKLAEELRLKKRAEEILKEETSSKKQVLNESLESDSQRIMTAEEFFGPCDSETCSCKKTKPIEVKAPKTKPAYYTSGYVHMETPKGYKPPKIDVFEDDNEGYVRPNKPFSKFSANEKREYWRAQKRKERNRR